MTPARYPLDDKPEFAADGRRYVYPTGATSWNRPPPSFIWCCPYYGCGFGPTDLEGAHQHLNAEHYSAQPVPGEFSRPMAHTVVTPSSDPTTSSGPIWKDNRPWV